MKGTHTGRVDVRQTGRWLIAALLVIVASLTFAGTAGAMTGGSTSTAPWIMSDQADYSPGSTVHLVGGNWQPGESVQIVTNDNIGNTWSQTDEVTSNASGDISDDIVLPNSFIASYSVTATGSKSGTATTSFTDSNVSVSGTVTDAISHQSVPGALVTCDTTGGCNGTFTALTDAFGNYAFDQAHSNKLTFGNAPANLTLTVSKAGYSNGAISLTNVGNNTTLTGENVALMPSTQDQTISFTQPTTPQSYGATFHVNPTSTSGLAVTVTAESGSVCSVASAAPGYDVTMTSGGGNCVLDANQAGNSGFNAAPSVTRTVAAQQRPITVMADARSKVYGAGDPTLTFHVTSGSLVGLDSFSGGLVRDPGEDVGQYDINQGTVSAGDNYMLTYVGAQLTISAKPVVITPDSDQSKMYGLPEPVLTYTNDGELGASTFTGGLSRATGENVGTYAIGLGTLSAGSNYSLMLSGTTVNFTISKASLTVTPDDGSRTYGQDAPLYTFTITGFVNGQDATTASGYTAPTCGSDYTHTTPVADSPRTISCSGGSADNYSFNTDATAQLTISKASLTVTPDDGSRTYGQDAPLYTFTITGFVNGQDATTASGYTAPTCGSDYTHTTPVADSPRTISCSGGSADNYSFNTDATAQLTISKATPNCSSISGYDSVYNGNPHTATGACKGVDGNALSGLDKSGTTHTKAGTYNDDPWTFSDITGNYNNAGGTVNDKIEQSVLSVSFQVQDKTWDGTTTATIKTIPAPSLIGIVTGDVVTVNAAVATANFADAGVGANKPVIGTGFTLGGADAGNYFIGVPQGTSTASILAWNASGKGFYAPVGIQNSIFTPAPGAAPTAGSSTIWNTVKGGQTVPLKFNVFAGTVEKTALTDITSFKQSSVPCAGGDGSDPVDTTTTGNTSLRYDTTAMQWIQNWKTPNYSASAPCYRATVTFADGSMVSAFFRLTK